MDLVMFVLLATLCGENWNIEHSMQTFQSKFFTPFMFTGTIDFYHFQVTLILARVTWSTLSKNYWLDFRTHFATDQDEISYGVEAVPDEDPDTNFELGLGNQGK